jgi:hypothetical protein
MVYCGDNGTVRQRNQQQEITVDKDDEGTSAYPGDDVDMAKMGNPDANDGDGNGEEFTETQRGYDARDKWAHRYDDLNGAPEGDWDR